MLLLLFVLCFLAAGFWPMKLLDRFLEENNRVSGQEDQTCEPSCVLLTEDMTDEEVSAEIRCYRKTHRHAKILLYENHEANASRLF